MKIDRVLITMAVLFAVVSCSTPPAPKADPPKKPAAREVELKSITLDALTAAIKEHRGKVVVVDVWATFCAPCKAEFPHLVELHHRYEKDVVCMSVTVDEENRTAAALKFLKDQEATFPNYQVDYAPLQNEWVFSGVPVVRVYAPSGEVAQQFTNADVDQPPFTYADVEKVVKSLLKK